MKNRFFATALLGISFVIAGAFTPLSVFAQGTEGLEITPAVIEDKVDPGETYSFTLTVKNIADTEKTYYFLAQDIRGLTEDGLPVFADADQEPTGYELSSWITLPGEPVTLKAGATQSVSFSIQIPTNASPGAHFGGVFFDTQPDRLRTSGASIGVRVGSIINLRIAGEVQEEARLREFSTGSFIYNAPPVDFKTRVENMGNVLLRPYGLIEITNMFGKKVGSVNVNESVAPVFPLSEREYTTMWEHDGFTFGKYSAVISVIYGDDVRRTITGATSFWILPAKPILTVLSILAGIILIMIFFTKMYVRAKLREMGVSTTSQGVAARQTRRSASRMIFVVVAVFLLLTAFMVSFFLMFA